VLDSLRRAYQTVWQRLLANLVPHDYMYRGLSVCWNDLTSPEQFSGGFHALALAMRDYAWRHASGYFLFRSAHDLPASRDGDTAPARWAAERAAPAGEDGLKDCLFT